MKTVLISIQPEWCELIASGEKTVEVRKTRPKIDVPFKVYIYQTKTVFVSKSKENDVLVPIKHNTGKVIGEFICDCCEEYWFTKEDTDIEEYEDVQLSCLTSDEILTYGKEKPLYFWNISNLVIYDKPRELKEFYTECQMNCEHCEMWGYTRVNADEFDMDCKSDWFNHKPLTRAPQSWCYVEGGAEC